jgi:hypothetical protein
VKIRDMPAGPALDYLMGEKVMKWELELNSEYWFEGNIRLRASHSWSPSTSIADAWQIVEKFQRIIDGRPRRDIALSVDAGVWHCMVTIEGGTVFLSEAFADTAEMAICRAALLAEGVEEVP